MSPEEFMRSAIDKIDQARRDEAAAAQERLDALEGEHHRLQQNAQGIPDPRLELVSTQIERVTAEQAAINPKYDAMQVALQAQANRYDNDLREAKQDQDRINTIQSDIERLSQKVEVNLETDHNKEMGRHEAMRVQESREREQYKLVERETEIGNERFQQEQQRASQDLSREQEAQKEKERLQEEARQRQEQGRDRNGR